MFLAGTACDATPGEGGGGEAETETDGQKKIKCGVKICGKCEKEESRVPFPIDTRETQHEYAVVCDRQKEKRENEKEREREKLKRK